MDVKFCSDWKFFSDFIFSPFIMPVIRLLLKAHLENVTNLEPEDFASHQWSVKLKCTGCRETSDKWRYIAAEETVDIPNSRGSANYVEKCSFCAKQNTINIVTDSFKPIEDSDEFKEAVKFECRGTEPVEYQKTGEWKCDSSVSNAKFTKIDLSDTWADYDENANEPVTIDDVDYKFE